MKTVLEPIVLNEQSYNVAILHQALKVLGYSVSFTEFSDNKAGQDTAEQVRKFQSQMNIPADNNYLVDQVTINAMTEAMTKRGLTLASRSFTVSGSVKLADGQIKKRQVLIAFDIDLKGVAAFRKVKSLADLRKNGGFEYLGSTTTDNQGNYSITFYDWQYGWAERKKADVIVYAVNEMEIVGHSRIVNSEDYSAKGLVRGLDLILTSTDDRTEYKVIESELGKFIKESDARLDEFWNSSDQLSFTAGELDIDLSKIKIYANAVLLAREENSALVHELLYGLGRQGIRLSWSALFKKKQQELRQAIAASTTSHIIREFKMKEVETFLSHLLRSITMHQLDDKDADNPDTLNAMLSNALPEPEQRLSFVRALNQFSGSDFSKFWSEDLPARSEFVGKPELVKALLLTQQLTALTGNHQKLVKVLQMEEKKTSPIDLLKINHADWLGFIKKSGLPKVLKEGEEDEDKQVELYANTLQNRLNAAFPTQRIAMMVEKGDLGIQNNNVSNSINKLISQNGQFDFAKSQIHDLDDEINNIAGDDFDEVRNELMELQRLFQVSTSPEAMVVLKKNKLTSAYTISNIARKNFIRQYSKVLGGEDTAAAIHGRAVFISKRAEKNAITLVEHTHGSMPATVMSTSMAYTATETAKKHISNYSELFGSPDLCECEHCRSVYGPAAYFVDLLRFLERSGALDAILLRRPDLIHHKLSCENTNTLIPYIDLANEVMEFYTATTFDDWGDFTGHNTDDATKEELRANPQNIDIEAYRILSDNEPTQPVKYPFTLPYHQPLDTIRVYGEHMGVSRYEVMQIVNPQANSTIKRAIEAESLMLSQEEYTIITNSTGDTTDLHKFYGYLAPSGLENLSAVKEFLERSGVVYIDLVEIVKTAFINPHQDRLDFLEEVLTYGTIDAEQLYSKLQRIAVGDLNSEDDSELEQVIMDYGESAGGFSHSDFDEWVVDHFEEFRQVLTLYQESSNCDLEKTYLKTIQSVYEDPTTSGIAEDVWSKMHRFIRLWRKLGWSIHETDLMLAALGETDITADTVSKLESVVQLSKLTKCPVNELATVWGNIDTYGKQSLYQRLFLNRSLQDIDAVFRANARGEYLQGTSVELATYKPAIRAAYRVTEEELDTIISTAQLIKTNNPDDPKALLNIVNLSTVYRYVVLARVLKLKITDLCNLIELFDESPFSIWDVETFTNIHPAGTLSFYKKVISVKEAGFNAEKLEYIFHGELPADSSSGLDLVRIEQSARTVRELFAVIDLNYPALPESPLTLKSLGDKLKLMFEPELVEKFIRILDESARFETITTSLPDITIPDELAEKFTYIESSGRFSCIGVMSDDELTSLKESSTDTSFKSAVQRLYDTPEGFITTHFSSVLVDSTEINEVLLNHPEQSPTPTLGQKLTYIYERFIRVLKSRLRQDAVIQHFSTHIGLNEVITKALISNELQTVVDGFAASEFTAIEQITVYHRAAKFIRGFDLNEIEVGHFIEYPADFDRIDFKALTIAHWERIRDYILLRNEIPQAQATLIDVFRLSRTLDTEPTGEELRIQLNLLRNQLHLATAWEQSSLEYLVTTHFSLEVSDFRNEVLLNRLSNMMQIVSKAGLSAEAVTAWGAADTGFDELYSKSQALKKSVKAKYGEMEWLELAGRLSNKIRENQQKALVNHLLQQQAIREALVTDADGLFEHLLIDVQMTACMETSRIVQASAAVQMFVNRILLNLETEVSPGSVDKERWQWMKNYRVWEANRKVFLYPENWLFPEWRNDRSEFFRELESYLVQNDITERSAEQGIRNYLTSLNQVANLEVCGMHREELISDNGYRLHVFARTHNTPYKYFYRIWNEYEKWSAWESVPVDIRSVEAGEDSGVHLVPVVWKNRLILFWPEFTEVNEAPSNSRNLSFDEAGHTPHAMSEFESNKHWEIRLAWSEYVEGKWSSKQVSKEFKRSVHSKIKEYSFFSKISPEGSLYLTILVWAYSVPSLGGAGIRRIYIDAHSFKLSDLQSPIEIGATDVAQHKIFQNDIDPDFMKRIRINSKLALGDDVYLREFRTHQLLNSDNVEYVENSLASPFFFSDTERTYFVRPVPVWIAHVIKDPSIFGPMFSGLSLDADEFVLDDAISGRGQPVGFDMFPTGVGPYEKDDISGGHEIATFKGSSFSGDKESESRAMFLLDSSLSLGRNGLKFHTFHHPYSSDYVQRLNREAIVGLMESDTELLSDVEKSPVNKTVFESTYAPSIDDGLVSKPYDFYKRTYFKENVCFDPLGANSLYNWELFFHAPLYIATRLSKNGKFEEAMKWFHFIYDPTTDIDIGAAESDTSRVWKVLPFKTEPKKNLEEFFKSLLPNSDNSPSAEDSTIREWRDNPFDPHLIASGRPLAYMKNVVIQYVENLVAWGDSKFRQFTRESVYEALQLYVIANHVLGPRPEFVPRRGKITAKSYDELKDKLDDFSNALVELENIFPYSSETGGSTTSTGSSILGIGSALYFCIPANEKLLEYWDTVTDRLFKIRHCQDIKGTQRQLALFAPPIDPALLIQAKSQGMSLGDILASLSSPPPIYRFTYLLQKANEFCGDVKALGSALLAALEKKDAEELGRLRASQETNMLELVTAIRERQVLEAKVNRDNLLKSRETAAFRLQHYTDLLGNELVTVPSVPGIDAKLTADSQLPADTSIVTIETDVDVSLVDSDENGVKLIPREKEDIDKRKSSLLTQKIASTLDDIVGVHGLLPNISGNAQPFGVGVSASFGGSNLAAGISAIARSLHSSANQMSSQAAMASTMASFIRREQDWTLQANLATREIIQLDKQITSADIRIQISEQELENHKQQILNTKEVETFIENKFTNQELYQWMKEQLYSVYKQSFNLAFDMARRVEKAYQYELGVEAASFINYGYWDNSMQGLVSGEKLQLALRQMENSYLTENRRELELRKSVSLALLDPLALIELRESGKCDLSLPEEIFDLDFQGHYFRRIKSVSLTLPCVVGPYTSVNCSLRLLNNTTRVNTLLLDGADDPYAHKNDEGLPIDDERFRTSYVPVTSIATSGAQNDSGMFEFSFRDERYLPFEGAGAISTWQVQLTEQPSTEQPSLRQFDYSTISDVVLHISYTAREDSGLFKDATVTHLKDYLSEDGKTNSIRMFNLKQEFPTQWNKFLYPSNLADGNVFELVMVPSLFPSISQGKTLKVNAIWLLARCTDTGNYDVVMTPPLPEPPPIDANTMSLTPSNQYGGLHFRQKETSDMGIEISPTSEPVTWQLKITRPRGGNLQEDPVTKSMEVEDLMLVLGYNWT